MHFVYICFCNSYCCSNINYYTNWLIHMYQSTCKIQVRYPETDKMGIVYHGTYATYYEIGRQEALRQLGSSYRIMEDSGIIMPVVSLWMKYYKPAYYDDILTIESTIHKLPGLRIKFDYRIINDLEKVINVARTTLVFLDETTRKPVKAPEWFLDLLRPFFTSNGDR